MTDDTTARLSDAQAAAIEAVDEELKFAMSSGIEDAVERVEPNPDDPSQVAVLYDPGATVERHVPGEGQTPFVLDEDRVEVGVWGEMASMGGATTVDDLPGPNPPTAIANLVDNALDAAALGVRELKDGRETLVLEVA